MHFIDEGPREAPIVLMVHGNPTWSFYYRNLVIALRDRYRCIVPDHIGCGLSGSVQHFAGMKTSGLIIAVNTDSEASITKNCDYFIVEDLFEIVPILTRQLKSFVGEEQ